MLALAWLSVTSQASAGGPFTRPYDPVVIQGIDLATLNGAVPHDIVAFRYEGGWQQIPVQVDERDMRDLGSLYGISCPAGNEGGAAGQAFAKPCGVDELVYTDAGTHAGQDNNATLDSNDEVSLMANDVGYQAPQVINLPGGVAPGSGVQVEVEDTLTSTSGYVYLFTSTTLDPAAGQPPIGYTFNVLSGPYLSAYNEFNGPNPEDSEVVTPFYTHHFSDRWISDELTVTAGGSTGVDVLDRHKALFSPGVCVRSEDTFVDGEGAFIANKAGPVRAIRSYLGANSGPLTQREHFFYEQREDIETYLRVHQIPGVMDFFDYSAAASGMTYYNNLNMGGVSIDGATDSVTAGSILWELVTGAQGSLVMAGAVATNVPGFAYTSYYLDDATPATTQCTGDAFAYGSSGLWINQTIPCTDPATSCTNYLRSRRTMYFLPPGQSTSTAQTLFSQSAVPLTYSITEYDSAGPAVGGRTDLANARIRETKSWPAAWLWGAVVGVGTLGAAVLVATSTIRRRRLL